VYERLVKNITMKRNVLLILLTILSVDGMAQKIDDIKKFENLFADKTPVIIWKDQMKGTKNEIGFIFSGLFVAYKEVVSSQDIDACVFTPSCSVYAMESIKKYGPVIGYLSAIDRLTRCNPGRNKNLPINSTTGKYYDPVK
jgi:putative component of membrane protein insertase Oxa1/YidC/SpoIIIJ protein YidD